MPQPDSTLQAGSLSPAVNFPGRGLAGGLGAVMLTLGPLQFFIIERIAASAWKNDSYSFYDNFISDLGVTNGPTVYQDRMVDSPLGWLMNLSFIVLGILVGSGIFTLSRSLQAGRHHTWVRGIGIGFGIGAILVGLFPENSVEFAHIIGAFLNIGLGNILLFVVGAAGHRYGMARWFSHAVILMGAVGSLAMIGLATFPPFFNGAVERVAAYPYMVTLIVLGGCAVARAGHDVVPATAQRSDNRTQGKR